MSRILRVVVLTAALLAATTASASAVTWHNSGDTSFTAAGGATTLHFGGVHMPCTGATVTGTTGTSPFTGTTWTAATGTLEYGHCTLAGQKFTVDCAIAETLSSQTGGVSSGTLHLMAKRNNLAAARWLLEHGADVSGLWDHWDSRVTALHLAIMVNHASMVQLLLDAGADTYIKDSKHESDSMGWAEFFERPQLVDMVARARARG